MKRILQSLRQTRNSLRTCFFAALLAAGSLPAFAQINMNGTDASGTGYKYESGLLIISGNGAYTVGSDGSSRTESIVVNDNLDVNITLNNVNLDVSVIPGTNACAFAIGNSSTVRLTLQGDNTLKSGDNRAGLQTGGGNARLEITAASDVSSLTATGGQGGAGIGGGNGGAGKYITISGGIVTATGNNAAGIGGSDDGAADNITISGGIVTAIGNNAAGIGGGGGGAIDNITISGGTVTATGNSAAGIGSDNNSYTRVCISGGSINSTFHSLAQPLAKNCSTKVYLNTLTVGNPAVGDEPVTAGSIDGVACDANTYGAYGIKDVKTDADGKVYFYLPATSDNKGVELTAGGKEYGKEYARASYYTYDQELVLLYGIELDPAGTHSFGSADYGYGAQSEYRVTVANTGTKSTGELTVALSGGNPSAFDLANVPVSDITFNGSDNFAVTPKTGLASGTYTATVTVSGTHGISASFAVNFTVKAEPTVDDLAFDLSDAVYNGRPLPVAVTAGEGVEGLGAITVRYDGYTYIPDLPGTYTVTVDIAAGDNYGAIEGLLLGTFTVFAPPRPDPIRRTVTLPSVAGAVTRPPAGRHVLVSGRDFEFILYPAAALAGYEPSVTTDRASVDGVDADPGVICTPNADGSYTVRIPAVRQDLTVAIAFPGASTGSEAVAAALTVYAVPGAIAVENARTEAVVLRIYTLAGALVRRLTAAPGTTRLTVAPGVYIVVTDDSLARWKTTVSD
jgi:hypothetical protein